MSCKHKDALGRPGEGFHKHFGGVAIGDVIGTVAIAAAMSYFTQWSFIIVLLVLLIAAEALHWYFCVDTAVIKFIKKYTGASTDSNTPTNKPNT